MTGRSAGPPVVDATACPNRGIQAGFGLVLVWWCLFMPTPSSASDQLSGTECVSRCLLATGGGADVVAECMGGCAAQEGADEEMGTRAGGAGGDEAAACGVESETGLGTRGGSDDVWPMKAATAGQLPRVYVYDLPPTFNSDLLAANPRCHYQTPRGRTGTDWQTMYSSEVLVHHWLVRSSAVVTDGEDADLFFVPVYASCFLHAVSVDFAKAHEFVGEAVAHIRARHPFWERSQGSDHVFVLSHDFGRCIAPENLLYHSIVMQTLGDVLSRAVDFPAMMSSLPGRKAQTSPRSFARPCFAPGRDIVIPPVVSDPRIYLQGVDGALQRLRADRDWLAYFRGTVWRNPQYSHGVRHALMLMGASDPGFHVHEGASASYVDEVRRSVFCLCPLGWSVWSPRLFDSIMLGCIPVIIADGIVLPWESHIDYRAFAIKVKEGGVASLPELLRAIPPHRVRSKQAALASVARYFSYYDRPLTTDGRASDKRAVTPSNPSNGDGEHGDALHMIVRELAGRARARRYKPVAMAEFS